MTRSILIADDSPVIRTLLSKISAREGFNVVTANDGFEALGKVVDTTPDLILLDILMPRLNGYDTCALIKAHPTLSQIPIILVSSKDSVFDQAKGRIVGCDGYLVKPFSTDDLLCTLRLTKGD